MILRGFFAALAVVAGLSSADAATYYVDPANRAASDSGQGTATVPFKTLGAALPRLVPGDRLLIAGGTYREAIDLRKATGLLGTSGGVPQTRIEGMSGATVTVRGSDRVRGWQRIADGVFVRSNWNVNSQQVFVDGLSLQQIGGTVFGGFPDDPNHPFANLLAAQGGVWPGRVAGGVNQLVNNSFYYDAAARDLYVKVPVATLDDYVVEVSVRNHSLFGDGLRNVLFGNLRFEHSNTTATTYAGAVTLAGERLILDRVHVARADGTGIEVAGDHNIIRSSSANYCGQLGIKARGTDVRLLNNETSYNNTRGFNKWWEAGGAKFVGAGGLRDSQVSGHRAYSNQGDGLWFDWQNRNNRIIGNRLAYNRGMGLQYEASAGAHIYHNTIFANRQRGIYLPNSSDSVIAHNLIADNGLEGVVIVDERQAVEQQRTELIPARNYVAGNVIARNLGVALVLPGKGIVDNVSDANLLLGATSWLTFALGWVSATNPYIAGLPLWQSLSGQDLHSWQEVLPMSPPLSLHLGWKLPYPDYSAELSAAVGYEIPRDRLAAPVPAGIGLHPGPL